MTNAEDISVAFKVAAFHVVIASATIKRVMTDITKKRIITGTTIERVIASMAVKHIVTVATMQVVGVAVAIQGIIAILANVVPDGTEYFFTQRIAMRREGISQGKHIFLAQYLAVRLKRAVIVCLLRVLHEFFGERCQVGIFAIGVAFGEQFAEVGECLAGIFCVDFVKEGGDAAVVQLQFAFFVHAEADGVEVGFEAGLEEQAVVEVVGKVGVGFFDGVEGVLRLCLGAVVEVGGIGAGEGVEDGDFLAQCRFLFLLRVFDAKQRPDIRTFYRPQCLEFARCERDGVALAAACHDEIF